jgi:histidinol phosphatase-like enzyme
MDDPRPKTLFLDIDGVLLHQYGGLDQQILQTPSLLPGVLEKLHEWDAKGYNLILVTGRKHSMRSLTEKQLQDLGVYYDQLLMGVGGGVRVLVNNDKTSFPQMETAIGITIRKNKGLVDLEI